MEAITRREVLKRGGVAAGVIGASGLVPICSTPAYAAKAKKSAEKWMDRLMARHRPGAEQLGGTLYVGRFRDPMYFLTKSISWGPSGDQVGKFEKVEVPAGFVTDFASIPQSFWSELRPDGDYAYAAVIHDYLYWTQAGKRDVADQILDFGMQDLKVDRVIRAAIYRAVRLFGGLAWRQNARLKTHGERRILKIYPDDPTMLWGDWKKRPEVFADATASQGGPA